MTRRPATVQSISADTLHKYRQTGFSSPVLDARLQFMDAEGLSRYARAIKGQDRIYPHVHPLAQASGRWSTTNPALVNFPSRPGVGPAWGMILPDDGWYFLHYDMESLHARIAAAYTKDQDDLACFRNGWDLHTLTACRMWGWQFLPPDRAVADPSWQGKSDRRRRLAKITRYALLLGFSERSALESRDIEKEGLTRENVLEFARLYLTSKPGMVAAKMRIWDQCVRDGKARSFQGRLRRLSFDPQNKASIKDAMKEGWSHILQGGEQDIMTTVMASIWKEIPDAILVLNSHDSHVWSLPAHVYPPQETVQRLSPLVERVWEIAGEQVPIPASWEIIYPDASIENPRTPFKLE